MAETAPSLLLDHVLEWSVVHNEQDRHEANHKIWPIQCLTFDWENQNAWITLVYQARPFLALVLEVSSLID